MRIFNSDRANHIKNFLEFTITQVFKEFDFKLDGVFVRERASSDKRICLIVSFIVPYVSLGDFSTYSINSVLNGFKVTFDYFYTEGQKLEEMICSMYDIAEHFFKGSL